MSGFQHSVKVPTQYKRVAAILKTALENRQKSLKTLIYEEKHAVSLIKKPNKTLTRVYMKYFSIFLRYSVLVACKLF